MVNAITVMSKLVWSLMKIVLRFIVLLFVVVGVPLLFIGLVFFVYYFIKGKRIKRRTVKRKKPHYGSYFPYYRGGVLSILKRLFIDFPRRLVLDIYDRDPDQFDTFGVHVFAGEQGSGKTIAAMHFIKCLKERNPMCKIASNIDLDYQDDVINDWKDIMNKNNDEHGQVVMIDELQNWFSSNESKNFPPEMLTEITQQRKQRKCVVGTSQVFTRVSKPIREQVTFLYRPVTFFGCLTFVRVYKLTLTDDGTVDKMHLRKMYFFVHDDELRNCYDTYEKVQRISLVGFQDRSQQISSSGSGQTVPTMEELRKALVKSK